MKKILLTGFMPFGGEKINPSWLAVEKVQAPENARLVKCELPVSYLSAPQMLRRWMDEYQPDCVVCVGQAGGRKAVTVEQVAINLMDAGVPDNDGFMAEDMPVVDGGENALFSTLPVKTMVQAMKDAGVPAARSLSAGSYVCNCVLYSALHYAQEKGMQTKCCFVHVPFIPEQTEGKDAPSMPLEDVVCALDAALAAITEETV